MKKIIIGIPSLISGGVEVSLIRFIKELSQNKNYQITLLLLKKEGLYLKDVPKEINIITIKYTNEIYDYNHQIKDVRNIKGLNNKIKFILYRLKLKKYLKHNNWIKYYQLVLSKTIKITEEYDLAIDWHGYGHFITTVIASLVSANKKAMWIHDEKTDWLENIIPWLKEFDKIFCVSKSCQKKLSNNKEITNKLEVFYNMTDYSNIKNLSQEKSMVVFNKKVLNIVTVGRLVWQKGYDLALEIASDLKQKNIAFNWYFIGDGPLKEELQKEIINKNLQEEIKLLGIVKNPYPIIKNANLYLQPSRHEGYGLAIEEARMLKTIVIATNLDCIKEQITDGINGFLCEFNASDFSEKIITVSQNKTLIKEIKTNLAKDTFDRRQEFEKIKKLLEE